MNPCRYGLCEATFSCTESDKSNNQKLTQYAELVLDCAATAATLYSRPPREEGVEFYSFDDSYLQRLREHDFQTEQHFVAYFSKLILIKLRSRVRSSSAIDDIRQETFVRVLKVVRAEGGVRNAERLGGFVNSVCNNVLQEFYRSFRPRRVERRRNRRASRQDH